MNKNIIAAAITVAMNMSGLNSNQVIEISKSYGVDHRDVMAEVLEMLQAETMADTDMNK